MHIKQQLANKLLLLILIIPLFSFSQESERILEIRALYSKITNNTPNSADTVSWSESESEDSYPLERTFVYSYFENNLSKLNCEIRQDHSWISAEYYFEDNTLFFAFLIYDGVDEVSEDRLYFTKSGEIEMLLVNSGKGNVELSDLNKIDEIKQETLKWLDVGNTRLKYSEKSENNIVAAKEVEKIIKSVENNSEEIDREMNNTSSEEKKAGEDNIKTVKAVFIGVLLGLIYIIIRRFKKSIKCGNCNKYNYFSKNEVSKINVTYMDYMHVNKDGSPDRRYSDNSEWGSWEEVYCCKKCKTEIIVTDSWYLAKLIRLGGENELYKKAIMESEYYKENSWKFDSTWKLE
jgi:hypothetical protein|tara:strand:- start:3076 stop:4119 length:1044 start_codon:yes stop_codon:yes gene_type:complete